MSYPAEWCGAVLLAVLMPFTVVMAEELSADALWHAPETIKKLLRSGELTEENIPDPHWKSDACVACHTGQSGFSKTNVDQKTRRKSVVLVIMNIVKQCIHIQQVC